MHTKINSKWIKDLNVKPETIKILEDNRGSNFSDICIATFFLDISPVAREIKAKINYRDFIKIKSFCTVKETINKTKRQPMEWEKILQMTSDKGILSKVHKELITTQHPKNKSRN